MNQALGVFQVCCKIPQQSSSLISSTESYPTPASVATVQSQNIISAQSQSLAASTTVVDSCPVISSLPPVSSCAGRHSNCWSVGVQDLDCLDNAFCCFDGCANVCQGRGEKIIVCCLQRYDFSEFWMQIWVDNYFMLTGGIILHMQMILCLNFLVNIT